MLVIFLILSKGGVINAGIIRYKPRKTLSLLEYHCFLLIGVFAIARGSEVLIEKKTDVKFTSEKTKVNKTVIMAMLSAIAVILMYFVSRTFHSTGLL